MVDKQYFKSGSFQSIIDKYPETIGRKFRSIRYTDYNWLECSIAADKAFCSYVVCLVPQVVMMKHLYVFKY